MDAKKSINHRSVPRSILRRYHDHEDCVQMTSSTMSLHRSHAHKSRHTRTYLNHDITSYDFLISSGNERAGDMILFLKKGSGGQREKRERGLGERNDGGKRGQMTICICIGKSNSIAKTNYP